MPNETDKQIIKDAMLLYRNALELGYPCLFEPNAGTNLVWHHINLNTNGKLEEYKLPSKCTIKDLVEQNNKAGLIPLYDREHSFVHNKNKKFITVLNAINENNPFKNFLKKAIMNYYKLPFPDSYVSRLDITEGYLKTYIQSNGYNECSIENFFTHLGLL